MNDILRTIDYCKGKIKSLETARKALPFEKFNQRECDKITKKLYHYKLIVTELSKINKSEELKTNDC